jgi:hypothetical protein
LKDVLKNSNLKNKIKQWSKRARVAPNSMVGPPCLMIPSKIWSLASMLKG